MKNNSLAWVLGLILLGCSQVANAEIRYWSLQYSQISFDTEGFAEELEPSMLVLRFGAAANNYFSLEGRLGLGVQDDTLDLGGFGEVDLNVNYLAGLYGIFHTDIYNTTQVYGVIGFTQLEIELSGTGGTEKEAESSGSFGIGANFGPVNLEYMLYLDEDDYETYALSIGYIRQFE